MINLRLITYFVVSKKRLPLSNRQCYFLLSVSLSLNLGGTLNFFHHDVFEER